MSEVKGTYKNTTKFVTQVKHYSRHYFNDNLECDSLEEAKRWVEMSKDPNTDWRIVKRSIKEDIIK